MADYSVDDIGRMFEAAQSGNDRNYKLEKSKVKSSEKNAKAANKSAEKIAAGRNETERQIAEARNQVERDIAAGRYKSEAEIAAARNQVEREIAAARNQTEIQQTTMQTETQRHLGELEAQTRLQVQEREAAAERERQTADIQARFGLADKEQAAAMARLERELGVRREDQANQLLMSRERLGFDREQLAANVQIERDKLTQAREEMEKIGIPRLVLDKWRAEKDVELAQSAQQIEHEKVGIERGRLGLEAYKSAVDLASSPAKYFQFGDFAQGLTSNPQMSTALKQLGTETAGAGYGPSTDIAASGTAAITPQQALGSMLAFLGANQGPAGTATAAQQTGQPANPAMQAYLDQQARDLAAVQQTAKAGGSALAPGSLERVQAQDPDTLAKFTSGLSKLRYDVPAWMKSYQRAGVYNAAPEVY